MANDAPKRMNVLPAQGEQTTVGNYFVSNYPPYSLWTNDRVPEALDRLARPSASDAGLGLYVHIPFCRKRCHFCYFRVYTDRNKDDIGHWSGLFPPGQTWTARP